MGSSKSVSLREVIATLPPVLREPKCYTCRLPKTLIAELDTLVSEGVRYSDITRALLKMGHKVSSQSVRRHVSEQHHAH